MSNMMGDGRVWGKEFNSVDFGVDFTKAFKSDLGLHRMTKPNTSKGIAFFSTTGTVNTPL